MNPIGVHALVWVGDWSHDSARRAIESSKQAGFDLVEVPLFDPTSVDTGHTRQVATDNGLGLTCSLGLGEDTDISSEDPVVHQRGLDLLAAAAVAASEMGATHLCGVLYSKLGRYFSPQTPASRQRVIETLQWLSQRTAGSGLDICLEVVNRYETNVANTAKEMVAIIEESGTDIGIHLDSYHMNIEEQSPEEAIAVTGERFRYLHIGESHRGYLGTGSIDFPRLFSAVRASGYAGPVTFESFSSAVVHRDLSTMLAIWRNTWSDGMDLAVHARSFIASHLAGAG